MVIAVCILPSESLCLKCPWRPAGSGERAAFAVPSLPLSGAKKKKKKKKKSHRTGTSHVANTQRWLKITLFSRFA